MKRIVSLLLCAVLLCSLFLTACGEQTPAQTTTATNATTATTGTTAATTVATTETIQQELSLYDLMTSGATIYNAKGISTGKTPLETEATDLGTIAYGTVLTQDSLDAIGIANDKMSAQELRELCL